MSEPTIEGIDWVKKHPAHFFANAQPDPIQILAFLMADILVFGKGVCRIGRADDWWGIGSDDDWMHHPEFSMKELFEKVVAAPEHGRNSARGEVLLGAFAADVVVTRFETRQIVKGSLPPDQLETRLVDQLAVAYFVLFRM